uniref:Uncharacterized protein n=1 Tax=Knipowitschia caucasica TaxID=637954 RepID=A0AAV2KQG0_KNICA
MSAWIIYLSITSLCGPFHVLALHGKGRGPPTPQRSLLESLLQWSTPDDNQGVLGEYTEPEYVQESSELPGDVRTEGSSLQHTLAYEGNGSTTIQREEQPTSAVKWDEPASSTGVDLLKSIGTPAPSPTKSWEWTSLATKRVNSLESGVTDVRNDDTSRGFQNTTTAPCLLSNDTDDYSPQPSNHQHLSLPLSLSLFIPLYSDWNSALATWGLAWEAHVYGLVSIFASQDSKRSIKLAGTKQMSESKQLEWDMAVQAEFVNVCRQIDALSVCSDTIDL